MVISDAQRAQIEANRAAAFRRKALLKHAATPSKADRFTFGKHVGKTFIEIAYGDPGYCSWAKKQQNPIGQLKDFVDLIIGSQECDDHHSCSRVGSKRKAYVDQKVAHDDAEGVACKQQRVQARLTKQDFSLPAAAQRHSVRVQQEYLHISAYLNVCLLRAFQNIGIPVDIDCSGPFWAQRDGNRYLAPFRLTMSPVPNASLISFKGRYVVYTEDDNGTGHFYAILSTPPTAIKFDTDITRTNGRCILSAPCLQAIIDNPNVTVYAVLQFHETFFADGGWRPPWSPDRLGGMRSATQPSLCSWFPPKFPSGWLELSSFIR
jgi:hypothetical protein